MTKRSNGEGTVFREAGRGGWVGQITLDGKRRKVRAKTKTDVLAKLDKLKRDADGGIATDGNATVGQILDQWRTRVLPNRARGGAGLSAASTEGYDWALNLLRTELGSVRLRSLTVDAVESAIDRIATGRHGRGKPLARRSLKMVRSTLAQALDLAVRKRMIPANPARAAELTPTATPARRRRSLTGDEAEVLWAALDGKRAGNLFRLMLLTGLRPGEALGLCWDAVDLDAGLLHVHRAIRRVRGRSVLGDGVKTDSSYRTIALPAPAVDVLRAQRVEIAKFKLAARVWSTNGHDLVFPSGNGVPYDLSHARRELEQICAAAGVPRITPHELRHSCASILNDRGVPLELIADLLGHRDVTTLTVTYRHRLRPSADAAVAVMGQMFGS